MRILFGDEVKFKRHSEYLCKYSSQSSQSTRCACELPFPKTNLDHRHGHGYFRMAIFSNIYLRYIICLSWDLVADLLRKDPESNVGESPMIESSNFFWSRQDVE